MLIFVVVWGEHALLIPNFVMEHNINKLQKNQQGSELTKTMHSPGLYSWTFGFKRVFVCGNRSTMQ